MNVFWFIIELTWSETTPFQPLVVGIFGLPSSHLHGAEATGISQKLL